MLVPHALCAGSNAGDEANDTTFTPPASALLQNAQNMLARQQEQEASAQAAVFAANDALQQAQVLHAALPLMQHCHSCILMVPHDI